MPPIAEDNELLLAIAENPESAMDKDEFIRRLLGMEDSLAKINENIDYLANRPQTVPYPA